MAVAEATLPLHHNGKFREYSLVYSNEAYGFHLIEFCPFCGVRLPASLRVEWFDRVDALGIAPNSPELREEMLDDRWWRDET